MASRTPSTPRVTGLTLSSAVSATPTPMQQLGVGGGGGGGGGGGSSHPVEVVGRIREHPDGRDEPSAIQVLPNGRDLRIRQADHLQYREFSLDGVSRAEDESLEAFYKRYAEARVEDVKGGGKCTIMMYGPTGAGKSHTMFGSQRERGVAYHALRQIMGETGENCSSREVTVRASVWEIFNEEIFDLLAQTSNPPGSMKGASNRVKLVMRGHRVVNSTTQEDTDAHRLVKEIQKVEKRRVTKSTNCNDRSSRSHCVVTFEVPAVGGRLVLVDMAGSENIEQAGIGMDARMQTGKINQGNGALKRVVEAIAAQSDHIPYRDSKLTMLLQDSFETVNAKILMILCASPCPRDLYKTMGTFEYGAKAKTIVRLPNSPAKEKIPEADVKTLATMQARIAQKDVSIENLRREKERSEREKEAKQKEVTDLKRRVEDIESQLLSRKDDLARGFQDTKLRLEELERQLELKQKELDFQRSRADKAEAELNELKKSLKSDSKESGGRSIKYIKVESTASRLEKTKSLSDRSNGFDGDSPLPISSSPKTENAKFTTPVTKKFSSSVLSFFRSNSDPQEHHSSKKASLSPEESGKHKESPAQSVSTGERKRKEQSSTLRDLLSRRGEEQVSKTLKSSQEVVVREHRIHEDTQQSWPTVSDYVSVVTPPSNEMQTEPESMICDSSPEEEKDDDEEMALQVEKDPLGLGTWSETRLHRKGWLPIIHEEQEDEGEDPSAARPFASCPRFTDASSTHRFISSLNGTVPSAEPPSQNLYRDKFILPVAGSEEEEGLSAFERRLEAGGGVRLLNFVDHEMDSPKKEEPSDVDSLIGMLTPRRGGLDLPGTSGREEPETVEAATARKARIENIFMLCGHSREVKSRTNPGDVESPMSSRSPGSRKATPEKPKSGGNVARELYSLDDSVLPLSPAATDAAAPPPPQTRLLSPLSSRLSSFRGNQSHLCLEADGYYSPARPSPMHRVSRSYDEGLLSHDNLNSYLASPLPVLPSPQKSDSPARHRKFRNGSLFSQPRMSSDLGLLTTKLDDIHETSPIASRLPTPSSLTPGYSVANHANENVPLNPMTGSVAITADGLYADENVAAGSSSSIDVLLPCDVYVKWESGKDSSGKLICELKVDQGSTLSELRRQILPHIAPTSKHAFSFLMLGDAGGAPVERELESELRVSSLPRGPVGHSSRLVSLRPTAVTPSAAATGPSNKALVVVTPFRPIENQLTTASNSLPLTSKLPSKLGSSMNGPNSTGKLVSATSSNSSSLVKGLRTLANGVGIRAGSTAK